MAHVPMWRRYLRFFGPDVKGDVNDELHFHLEAKTRELKERGYSESDAKREALRHFGDLDQFSALCEQIGEERSRKLGWQDRMAEWWYDVRYASRSLRQAPWFACVAILTLAAGIAGAASLFSIVDAWIIRAVRFPQPQQLIYAVSLDSRRGRENTVSFPDYVDLAARARQLQSLAAWSSESFTLSPEGAPERVSGALVSTNFFDTLAVKPVLGRNFLSSEGEFGRHQVAIVSYGFWKARLNGNPGAVGSHLKLNGDSYTVVGVLPEHFHFTLGGRCNLWIPLAPEPASRANRRARYLQMIGRMRPGVSVFQARDELKSIASQLSAAYPDTNLDIGSFSISLSEEIGRHTGANIVLIVFGVTLGLLLIACSNVANLMLVRALGRKRQAAIQMSLGASRGRLIRQALVETVILFLLSASAGAVGGAWLTNFTTGFIPFENRGYLPDYGTASLSWTVLAFVVGLALITGLIFGLAPALEGSGSSPVAVLKESGSAVSQSKRARRFRFALVIGQIAMATVLLSATAVLVRSFRALISAPMGFESTGILTFRVALDEHQYNDPVRKGAFFESLAESLATPQSGKVAFATSVPFGNDSGQTTFRILGTNSQAADERHPPSARFYVVSPDFFAVLKTPLLSGRSFERVDSPNARLSAIVNDAFVAQHFQGRDPLGQSLQLSRMKNRAAVIVGVVREIRENNEPAKASPQIYVPFAQATMSDAYLMVKSSGDPMALVPAIRSKVLALDPRQAIYDVETLDERINGAFAPYQIISGMLVWFGLLALVLAAVGVYGVVAFSVSRQTREIGIRAALGANRIRLQLQFLRQGLWLLAAGLVPGLLAALAVTFGLRSVLEEIVPANFAAPLVFTASLLAGVVLIATVFPARRAASVDPLAAIRYE